MAVAAKIYHHQYLTFTLSDELFALDIAWVKEILDDKKFTAIPMAPYYIRGVINVRGKAVPVVDLRLLFNMPKTEMTVNTCVIICELGSQTDAVVVGFLADSVQEVIEMQPDQIDPPPKMGAAIDSRRIKGMGKKDSEFIIVLDMDEIFGEQGVEEMQSLAAESAA